MKNTSVDSSLWGQFLGLLATQAQLHQDRQVISVRPAYTSQTCSVCGVSSDKKPLDVKQWSCVHCGALLDREYNATVNVMVAASGTESLNGHGRGVSRRITQVLACSNDAVSLEDSDSGSEAKLPGDSLLQVSTHCNCVRRLE